MALLSEHKVDLINDILVENGVSYDHLREDLLDHVCCLVEDQIDEGRSFHEGLDKALEQFGLQQLKVIQETTLYLINSKFNTMKKIIGITGLITSLMVILGVIFKVNHWPGANILLVIGIASTSLAVLPMLAYHAMAVSNSTVTKVTNLIGYVSGLLISLGVLFKIMHWPGAMILLWIGVTAMLLLFMPLYTFNSYKMAENKLFALSKSLLVVAGIVVVWGLSTLRGGSHWGNHNHPEHIEVNE